MRRKADENQVDLLRDFVDRARGAQAAVDEILDPERAHARTTDPNTSKSAAASMTSDRLSFLQWTALRALEQLGGEGINDQIVDVSGEEWNTITPRMRPLAKKGCIRENGKRLGSKRKPQIVWSMTSKGRRLLQAIPP